jgi:hypothetical protein
MFAKSRTSSFGFVDENITSAEVAGVRKRAVFADFLYYYADISGWVDPKKAQNMQT